jgi:hypothetical protein
VSVDFARVIIDGIPASADMAQTFDEQLRRALDTLADRVHRDLSDGLDRLTADISSAAEVERADASARTAAAAAETRSLSISLQRVLDGFQALDRATSLSMTLDALAVATRQLSARSALLLVRGDTLRGWAIDGFTIDESRSSSGVAGWEVLIAAGGVLADVARMGLPQTVSSDEVDRRPSFARSANRGLVTVPVAMNGEVVAVVCAEPRADAPGLAPLSILLELLARHAARVLESTTARRLAHIDPASHIAVAPQTSAQVLERP